MSSRHRILLLVCIMTAIVIAVETVVISMLYHVAINEEKARLKETSRSQACLIEEIARFDKKYSQGYPHGPFEATLSQIIGAHSRYRGFGKTGEFTLARREGDKIIFLLNHRHYDLLNPKPVQFNSNLAVPMQLAVSGKSGTTIDLDYRGEKVLAAYEPVNELGLGIVAKIDLSEIRAPFIRATFISGLIAVIGIVVGTLSFFKVTNPLIVQLSTTIEQLQDALQNVKLLSGLLPICASCKKIRDDKGYWNQIETYIRDHTEVKFTHGICPDCKKKLYPELYK